MNNKNTNTAPKPELTPEQQDRLDFAVGFLAGKPLLVYEGSDPDLSALSVPHHQLPAHIQSSPDSAPHRAVTSNSVSGHPNVYI